MKRVSTLNIFLLLAFISSVGNAANVAELCSNSMKTISASQDADSPIFRMGKAGELRVPFPRTQDKPSSSASSDPWAAERLARPFLRESKWTTSDGSSGYYFQKGGYGGWNNACTFYSLAHALEARAAFRSGKEFAIDFLQSSFHWTAAEIIKVYDSLRSQGLNIPDEVAVNVTSPFASFRAMRNNGFDFHALNPKRMTSYPGSPEWFHFPDQSTTSLWEIDLGYVPFTSDYVPLNAAKEEAKEFGPMATRNLGSLQLAFGDEYDTLKNTDLVAIRSATARESGDFPIEMFPDNKWVWIDNQITYFIPKSQEIKILGLIKKSIDRGWPVLVSLGSHARTIIKYDNGIVESINPSTESGTLTTIDSSWGRREIFVQRILKGSFFDNIYFFPQALDQADLPPKPSSLPIFGSVRDQKGFYRPQFLGQGIIPD